MQYNGTKLTFTTSAPTQHELDTLECIELTSRSQWNPYEFRLGKVQTKEHTLDVRRMKKVISNINGIDIIQETKTYSDIKSDDVLLSDIDSPLVCLKETLAIMNENDQLEARRTFISMERHKKANIDTLVENWCFGPRKALATMHATTQRGTRSAILPLSRRYRADRQYNIKRLNSKFATDSIWSDIRSINNHKYAQVYTHKCGFASCYPIHRISGDQIGYSLRDFINNFGVPEHLTFDGYSSHVGKGSLFMQTVRKYNIDYHVSGIRRPNENPVEGSIREIKQRWYRIMTKKQVLRRLWDYGLVWTCETGNVCTSSSRYTNKRTAIEIITGKAPDISEYIDFGFYDWVSYRANAGLGETSIGRWLGVSHKVGQLMSY